MCMGVREFKAFLQGITTGWVKKLVKVTDSSNWALRNCVIQLYIITLKKKKKTKT